MESSLNALVAGVLNIAESQLTDETGPNTVIEWDSLAHVTIAAAVEETYGIQFTMAEILGIGSLGDLRKTLRERGKEV